MRRVVGLACVVLAALLPAPAPLAGSGRASATNVRFAEIPASAGTLQALRRGGFVLYLRHGLTDNARADRVPLVDLDDCASQRPLTPAGREQAVRVGEAIRKAGIPLGELRISPLCRVRDTAAAAFPDSRPEIDRLLMYTANLTDTQKAPIVAHTRSLLAAPVAPGTNRLLIAHAPNLMDLIGYFPREGTLVVFRPTAAGGFEYVASVAPGQWSELLR